jgi:AraC-like DNA-binding protein
LRPYVDEYAGYRMEGFPAGVHMGLPSKTLTLIVAFGEPVDVIEMPDPAQRPDRYMALVGGLHAAPAKIHHSGTQNGIQMGITPAGARALFGMPASELRSTVVHLDDVMGPLGRELVERLGETDDWPTRFAILDEVLLAVLQPGQIRGELDHVWRRLAATSGAVGVAALAEEVELSRRHLYERFTAEFGLSPKVVARVMRFERARDLLGGGTSTLADAAAISGYTDQAHMTREWRRLAGSSPAAWMAEELPFVQDRDQPDG